MLKLTTILFLLGGSLLSLAEESRIDGKPSFGGYVDGYYAYDLGSPGNHDRSFTTFAARDNEFNINLAFLEANYSHQKIRSRFALQAGTSVQANYSSEPRQGTVSGPDLARHIQEARVGYELGPKTWIDAGVFFSHIGAETWIARDNLVLTRSLVGDYTPYYLSGVKLSHQFSDRFSAQLLVVNGWQVISDNNSDKSIGTSLAYDFDAISVSYNTLIGQEKSSDLPNVSRNVSRSRHFHDFIVRSRGEEKIDWTVQMDIGSQTKTNLKGSSNWGGGSVMARFRIDDTSKLPVRIEYFRDPDQIVLTNGTEFSSEMYGASVGYDKTLQQGVLWRSEVRHLQSPSDVFPDKQTRKQNNTLFVTSLALSF